MHQGAFLGAKWTMRRKASRQRSYHQSTTSPHSARWNVQVVRGKVTSRCLWNACKALTLGLALLLLGTAMATIGYYADQLSVAQEVRGNSTVRVKNESRGFHLNNLSYAGPIVMGVGGFIVVAACVMTFEARDSAAKVVPARLKFTGSTSAAHHKTSPVPVPASAPLRPGGGSRRSASCQTRWDNHLGLFRQSNGGSGFALPESTAGAASGGGRPSPSHSDVLSRRALTAAFVQFSRALHNRQISVESSSSQRRRPFPSSGPVVHGISKSPSAPNLQLDSSPLLLLRNAVVLGASVTKTTPHSRLSPHHQPHRRHPSAGMGVGVGGALLSPYLLQRQALSMDNPNCYSPPPPILPAGSRESLELGASAGVGGSQASMAMDLHLDCPVTLRVRDRSETARRHLFVRQRPVEDDAASGRSHRRRQSVTEEPSRLRASTGDFGGHQRYQYRRESLSRASVRLHQSRSVAGEDYGPRQLYRRGSDYASRRLRSPRPGSVSPYSITRSNTDESQRHDSNLELAYIRTSSDECDSRISMSASPINVDGEDVIQEIDDGELPDDCKPPHAAVGDATHM